MLNDGQNAVSAHNDFENITSVENLLVAWKEFVRGKRKKRDVQEFAHNLMGNIFSLHQRLISGTYKHSGYHAFKISDPKPRDIHKATVEDRLVHHAIYRQLYPFFDRTWVSDSYSCRDGKGTHKAMDRFQSFAYKVSRNHTRTCWVLKCDIRKFFASIDQETLLSIVVKHIPNPKVVNLIREILTSFTSTGPGKGLPLGNLTSQMLVNVYMNEFDQFVKHKLKCLHYIRYADDFVILADDRNSLVDLIPAIQSFLNTKLKLSLHPDKLFIKPFSSGVDFLGWIHYKDHRIFRTSSKKRMIRNLAKASSQATFVSYKGLFSHGNTHKLSTSYLQSYKTLI